MIPRGRGKGFRGEKFGVDIPPYPPPPRPPLPPPVEPPRPRAAARLSVGSFNGSAGRLPSRHTFESKDSSPRRVWRRRKEREGRCIDHEYALIDASGPCPHPTSIAEAASPQDLQTVPHHIDGGHPSTIVGVDHRCNLTVVLHDYRRPIRVS